MDYPTGDSVILRQKFHVLLTTGLFVFCYRSVFKEGVRFIKQAAK